MRSKPLVFEKFTCEQRQSSATLLVQNEPFELVVTLRNPFIFDLELASVVLRSVHVQMLLCHYSDGAAARPEPRSKRSPYLSPFLPTPTTLSRSAQWPSKLAPSPSAVASCKRLVEHPGSSSYPPRRRRKRRSGPGGAARSSARPDDQRGRGSSRDRGRSG